MTTQQHVSDGTRSYFAMIPHCVIDSDLSREALRLYLWYKKVTGENGQCWQSVPTICEGTRMSKPTVIKARNELEEAELIDVEVRGEVGVQRCFVTITDQWDNNATYVAERKRPVNDVDAPVNDVDAPRQSALRGPVNDVDTNKNTFNKNKKNKDCLKKVPSEFDVKAAEKLKEVVSTQITIPRHTRIKSWANHFRLLRERDGVSEDDIKETLRWYAAHIGDDFVPECYSGESFRRKYVKLRAAIQRASRFNGNGHVNGNGDYTIEDAKAQLARINGSM